MATDTLAAPKIAATTVGMQEKKPPLAAPLTMAKATNGPKEVETGQSTSILPALRTNDRRRVFTGPMESHSTPHKSRPIAEEKLKPATRPAPRLDERPSEVLYKGRKKGGTNKGKVPIAPARNNRINLMSLSSDLYSYLSSHLPPYDHDQRRYVNRNRLTSPQRPASASDPDPG